MSITRWIKPWSQKIWDDSTNKSSTRKKRILNERMDATEGLLLYIYIYIINGSYAGSVWRVSLWFFYLKKYIRFVITSLVCDVMAYDECPPWTVNVLVRFCFRGSSLCNPNTILAQGGHSALFNLFLPSHHKPHFGILVIHSDIDRVSPSATRFTCPNLSDSICIRPEHS